MPSAVRSVDAAPRPHRGHRLRQWRATVSNSDLAAWAAVAAFSFYVTIALTGGGGRSLTITFPLGCLLVAVFCYARSPATYVGFVFWTWILTPFLRRVFDLHFGFHPASPLLVGPVLATAVSGFTLLRRAPVEQVVRRRDDRLLEQPDDVGVEQRRHRQREGDERRAAQALSLIHI